MSKEKSGRCFDGAMTHGFRVTTTQNSKLLSLFFSGQKIFSRETMSGSQQFFYQHCWIKYHFWGRHAVQKKVLHSFLSFLVNNDNTIQLAHKYYKFIIVAQSLSLLQGLKLVQPAACPISNKMEILVLNLIGLCPWPRIDLYQKPSSSLAHLILYAGQYITYTLCKQASVEHLCK